MNEQIITREGYNKLSDELNYLNNIKRKEIAERIERAKELGDLSENAEYSEAKDAQALNEGRILELSNTLKNVTIVENTNNDKEKIDMGSIVKVVSNGQEKEYEIVSFNEADPLSGKISNESPLGMAFLNKKKGDEVMVETPRGEVKYKILNVKYKIYGE
jgi:transcription elongation factor GreA